MGNRNNLLIIALADIPICGFKGVDGIAHRISPVLIQANLPESNAGFLEQFH